MQNNLYVESAHEGNDFRGAPIVQRTSLMARPKSQFPAADMIERLTQRPPETCAVIAQLAGYREISEG